MLQTEIIDKNKKENSLLHDIKFLDHNFLVANKHQPRQKFAEEDINQLSDSIKHHGLLQPILVRKESTNKYIVIAGERRLRAAKIAGLQKIPCIIREETDGDELEIAVIENLQREELNPIEQARSFLRLIQEYGHSFESLSLKLGKDKTTIQNYVRLLQLPNEVIDGIENKNISIAHGKALLTLGNNSRIISRYYEKVVTNQYSVKQLETLIHNYKNKKPRKKGSREKPDLRHLCDQMKGYLGTKARIKGSDSKGTIELAFYSNEDLTRIIDLIVGNSIFKNKA